MHVHTSDKRYFDKLERGETVWTGPDTSVTPMRPEQEGDGN